MKALLILCVFLGGLSWIATATPGLSVTYVEGPAFISHGTSWNALSIGDSVPLDATVRLDAGASVDLKGTSIDMYLAQKGSYRIHDLLAERQKMGIDSVGVALSAKLGKLLSAGSSANQSTVGGVRGANESKNNDSEWLESSTQESVLRATDLLQAQKYDEAINKLSQALGVATEEELPELHYYLAYAYELKGDTLKAVKEAASAQSGGGDRDQLWAGDYVLLQAKLYLDTFAYAQAVQWMTRPENDLSGDAQRAALYFFVLGLVYRASGDSANAKVNFGKLLSNGADNDLCAEAADLLKNL